MSSNAAKEWSGSFKELDEKRAKTVLSLDESLEKVDRFLKTSSPRMGQGKQRKEVKSNITDNESGKMTTSKCTIQGYNGVATVDKKHQINGYIPDNRFRSRDPKFTGQKTKYGKRHPNQPKTGWNR